MGTQARQSGAIPRAGRPPEWIQRLPEIRATLEACGEQWLRRADVAAVFGVSRRHAGRLMATLTALCPDPEPDTPWRYRRASELLAALDRLAAREDIDREIRRRARVTARLDQIRRDARARQVVISTHPDRHRDIETAGVEIRPGVLTVQFSHPEDLFARLLALAREASGDWDAFCRRLGY